VSKEIQKKFLKFFEDRGHIIVPSSLLVPKDDPSVLLTTAGMQQFKPYYTEKRDPMKDFGSRRTASIQKSFRTSDIDEVGDESHLTFFEMLGNFSFGDYFKEDAIKWGWEFIAKKLGISSERCHVSVFDPEADASRRYGAGGDNVPFDAESYNIWKNVIGLAENKIIRGGRKDNFWGPTGNEGPCGPTSEIYVDGVEIWNLVFNEYYCRADKTLEPLKQNGVDTGMGLERLTMVVQDAPTIFETDLFEPIIQLIPHREILDETRAVRIIADHIRGAAFLIADGVFPSNVSQGYILRRLLRRAMRYGKVLNLENNFLIPLAQKVIEMYKEFYPELSIKKEDILTVIQKEEQKFSKTLERGLKELEKMLAIKTNKIISGNDAFYLYESYGFPMELTKELAREKGFNIDESGWKTAFEKHQELSRAGIGKKFGGHGIETVQNKEDKKRMTRLHTALHLLHQAIHDVIGGEAEVKQMGSDITPERGRFDFTFPRKLTQEEIKKIEDIINGKIKLNLPVTMKKMPKEEAMRLGARAFFKEKYPDEVNVYFIGDPDPSKAYSKELCGGPHVDSTGKIGHFKIIKEESSSAGVRRIRAIVE
jgi:alanyl-tRNA synthetase